MDKVTLNNKEQKRLILLNEVLAGRLAGSVARKLLYLATERITKQWTAPNWEWPKILNQLAVRFEGRFEL